MPHSKHFKVAWWLGPDGRIREVDCPAMCGRRVLLSSLRQHLHQVDGIGGRRNVELYEQFKPGMS